VLLSVGRIGRAHGLRGEVLVAVRTDDPDARFAPGTALVTDPPERGPLHVVSARRHSGRYVVAFAGVADRTAAEALRGLGLVVDSADLEPIIDPDEFHDCDLIGLRVEGTDGVALGALADVVHGPGTDLLVVGTGEREVLIPFVRDLVPLVDVAGGRIVVEPPEGLLDL